MPNEFEVNCEENLVATPRPGRANNGRHFRQWFKGGGTPAQSIKKFFDISDRTKVCFLQIKSREDGTAKQKLLMTIDGSTPNVDAPEITTGHELSERQIYKFNADLVRAARFSNIPTDQSKDITLVCTEMTI